MMFYKIQEILDQNPSLTYDKIIQYAIQRNTSLFYPSDSVEGWIVQASSLDQSLQSPAAQYRSKSGFFKLYPGKIANFTSNFSGKIRYFETEQNEIIQIKSPISILVSKNQLYLSDEDKIWLEKNLQPPPTLESTKVTTQQIEKNISDTDKKIKKKKISSNKNTTNTKHLQHNSAYLDVNHPFFSNLLSDCIRAWEHCLKGEQPYFPEEISHIVYEDKVRAYLRNEMKNHTDDTIEKMIKIIFPPSLQKEAPKMRNTRIRALAKMLLKKNPKTSHEEIQKVFSDNEKNNARKEISLDIAKKAAPIEELLLEIKQDKSKN